MGSADSIYTVHGVEMNKVRDVANIQMVSSACYTVHEELVVERNHHQDSASDELNNRVVARLLADDVGSLKADE